MSADALEVAGEFGEQVAEAQDRTVVQQIRNDVEDATAGHDVPDCPTCTGVTPVESKLSSLVRALAHQERCVRSTESSSCHSGSPLEVLRFMILSQSDRRSS